MSVIASALKHMLAAGMPHEAIIAAVAEMEAGLVAMVPAPEDNRSPGAKRTARYRENKRHKASQSVTHVTPVTDCDGEASHVTGTPSPAPAPLLPPDPQQPPAPTHTPARETPARKGTRLPEDWEPGPVGGKAGELVAGWPPGVIEQELEKFRNFWLAKAGRDAAKTDWQRTWTNWLISADERMARHDRANRYRTADDGRPGNPLVRAGLAFEAECLARSEGEFH